jgi:hypothetical protein
MVWERDLELELDLEPVSESASALELAKQHRFLPTKHRRWYSLKE